MLVILLILIKYYKIKEVLNLKPLQYVKQIELNEQSTLVTVKRPSGAGRMN